MKWIYSKAHQPPIICPTCRGNMFYCRSKVCGEDNHWLMCLNCGVYVELAVPPIRFFISTKDLLEVFVVEPLD